MRRALNVMVLVLAANVLAACGGEDDSSGGGRYRGEVEDGCTRTRVREPEGSEVVSLDYDCTMEVSVAGGTATFRAEGDRWGNISCTGPAAEGGGPITIASPTCTTLLDSCKASIEYSALTLSPTADGMRVDLTATFGADRPYNGCSPMNSPVRGYRFAGVLPAAH